MIALVGTNGQGVGTSSFSRWVKNVSALELPVDQRIQVDKLIDHIYDEMDEGKKNCCFFKIFNFINYNASKFQW